MQERHNSSALAMELRLSCTIPSMCGLEWKNHLTECWDHFCNVVKTLPSIICRSIRFHCADIIRWLYASTSIGNALELYCICIKPSMYSNHFPKGEIRALPNQPAQWYRHHADHILYRNIGSCELLINGLVQNRHNLCQDHFCGTFYGNLI